MSRLLIGLLLLLIPVVLTAQGGMQTIMTGYCPRWVQQDSLLVLKLFPCELKGFDLGNGPQIRPTRMDADSVLRVLKKKRDNRWSLGEYYDTQWTAMVNAKKNDWKNGCDNWVEAFHGAAGDIILTTDPIVQYGRITIYREYVSVFYPTCEKWWTDKNWSRGRRFQKPPGTHSVEEQRQYGPDWRHYIQFEAELDSLFAIHDSLTAMVKSEE